MSEIEKIPKAGPEKPQDDRETRRAAALRENLRRRKAQARAREDAEKPEPKRD